MSEPTLLRYWLELDSLNGEHAVYVGTNDQRAVIDRAAFDSQGKPLRVTLVIGEEP